MDLKIYYPYVFVLIAKPGSPTIAQLDIEATSLAVKWTAPADDGGSPITAYRVVILKGNTEIKNVNVTDPDTTSWNAGGLQRDTEYTVKVLAENAVFEGPPVENKVKTKYKGNKMLYLVLIIFWSVTIVRACEPEPRAASREPIFASRCFFFLYIYFLAFSS